MPAAKCKFFQSDGRPVGPGCLYSRCTFVHPEDKDRWDSLPWCKYFDKHGNPGRYGVCKDGKNCRFKHPDSAKSARDGPSKPLPLNTHFELHKGVISPLDATTDTPGASKSLSVADNVRMSLPRLQTDGFNGSYANPTSLAPKNLNAPPTHTETPTSGNVLDSSLSFKRGSGSTSAETRVPIRLSSLDAINSPFATSSTYSQVTGNPKLQAWKKLTMSLAQAVDLRERLRDTERRTSMVSIGNIPNFASPSQQEDFFRAEKDNRNDIEDKLNKIITQLIDTDFWPLPDASEAMAHSEQTARLDHEGLIKRLDEVEAHLKKRAEMRSSSSQINTSTLGTDNTDMEDSSRPPKRRRTSTRGSFIRISDVEEIRDRLDRLEFKISEMEKGEIWESSAERIEELLERTFQQSSLSGAQAGEGLIHARGEGVSVPETSQKPVETLMQDLTHNFNTLCEELAGHLPAVGKLEADMGKIRGDFADSKETMTSLDSSYRQMREQLDSLSRQTKDISSEIINRRVIPSPGSNDTDNRDYIARMARQDIKEHIATARRDLTNLIASQFMDAQGTILTDFESTIVKTNYVYNAMARLYEDNNRGR